MAKDRKEPDYADGKICYIIIPAEDIAASAAFYEKCFGWNIRRDGDGNATFDDPVYQVSGMWATGLKPHTDSGLMIHIMVADIAKTCDKITENGGNIVKPFDRNDREITADFTDPAGNLFGLYESRSLAA